MKIHGFTFALLILISFSECSCPPKTIIYDFEGTIQDGSGDDDYDKNISCEWLFVGGEGMKIHLTFQELSTECLWDYLFVHDGNSSAAPQIAAFNGDYAHSLPFEVVSSSNYLYLHFYSDMAAVAGGFRASFYQELCPYNCSYPSGVCLTNGLCSCLQENTDDYCRSNNLKELGTDTLQSGSWRSWRSHLHLTGHTLTSHLLSSGKHVLAAVGGVPPAFSQFQNQTEINLYYCDYTEAKARRWWENQSAAAIGEWENIFAREISSTFCLEWTKSVWLKGQGPRARYGHCAVADGDLLYIYGGVVSPGLSSEERRKAGEDGARFSEELWVWNFDTAAWTQLPSPSSFGVTHGRRAWATMIFLDNAVYVFGGFAPSANRPVNDILRYRLADGQWERLHVLATTARPGRRLGHSALTLPSTPEDPTPHSFAVYGGRSTDRLYYDLWVFNTQSLKWSVIPTDPLVNHANALSKHELTARYRHAMALGPSVAGRPADTLYVYGGCAFDESYRPNLYFQFHCHSHTLLALSLECLQWTNYTVSSQWTGRTDAAVVDVAGTGLLIIGGYNGGIVDETVMYHYRTAECGAFRTAEECNRHHGCIALATDTGGRRGPEPEELSTVDCVAESAATDGNCAGFCSHFHDCRSCASSGVCQWCQHSRACVSLYSTTAECEAPGLAFFATLDESERQEDVEPPEDSDFDEEEWLRTTMDRRESGWISTPLGCPVECSGLHTCTACSSTPGCGWCVLPSSDSGVCLGVADGAAQCSLYDPSTDSSSLDSSSASFSERSSTYDESSSQDIWGWLSESSAGSRGSSGGSEAGSGDEEPRVFIPFGSWAQCPTSSAAEFLAEYLSCADCLAGSESHRWCDRSKVCVLTADAASCPLDCPPGGSCYDTVRDDAGKCFPVCEDFHDGASCTSSESGGCMWCESQQFCFNSDAFPLVFPYGECESGWSNSPALCPQPCSEALSCGECNALWGCGWCSSTLEDGRCVALANASDSCALPSTVFWACPVFCEEFDADCSQCLAANPSTTGPNYDQSHQYCSYCNTSQLCLYSSQNPIFQLRALDPSFNPSHMPDTCAGYLSEYACPGSCPEPCNRVDEGAFCNTTAGECRCSQGYYGPSCGQRCDCSALICNDGPRGDGACVCGTSEAYPVNPQTYDQCGVCEGSNACLDCFGVVNGKAVEDECGVCGGDGSTCPGASCLSPATCLSGFCTDGVCCETLCNSTCHYCSGEGVCLPYNEADPDGECGSCQHCVGGECAPVAVGMDPFDDCDPELPSSCGLLGYCDGAGACAYYPANTLCVENECTDGFVFGYSCNISTHTCDPNLNVAVNCGKYACNAAKTGCLHWCTADEECSTGYYCDSGGEEDGAEKGECVRLLPTTAECNRTTQCETGLACLACGYCSPEDGSGCCSNAGYLNTTTQTCVCEGFCLDPATRCADSYFIDLCGVCQGSCAGAVFQCGSGECDCTSDYFGPNCEFSCETVNCVNGLCVSGRTASGQCSCFAGYWGATCSHECPTSAYNHLICGGHGTCEMATGACVCDDGWEGPLCDQAICDYFSNDCTRCVSTPRADCAYCLDTASCGSRKGILTGECGLSAASSCDTTDIVWMEIGTSVTRTVYFSHPNYYAIRAEEPFKLHLAPIDSEQCDPNLIVSLSVLHPSLSSYEYDYVSMKEGNDSLALTEAVLRRGNYYVAVVLPMEHERCVYTLWVSFLNNPNGAVSTLNAAVFVAVFIAPILASACTVAIIHCKHAHRQRVLRNRQQQMARYLAPSLHHVELNLAVAPSDSEVEMAEISHRRHSSSTSSHIRNALFRVGPTDSPTSPEPSTGVSGIFRRRKSTNTPKYPKRTSFLIVIIQNPACKDDLETDPFASLSLGRPLKRTVSLPSKDCCIPTPIPRVWVPSSLHSTATAIQRYTQKASESDSTDLELVDEEEEGEGGEEGGVGEREEVVWPSPCNLAPLPFLETTTPLEPSDE